VHIVGGRDYAIEWARGMFFVYLGGPVLNAALFAYHIKNVGTEPQVCGGRMIAHVEASLDCLQRQLLPLLPQIASTL
jgi:hypothetical protein